MVQIWPGQTVTCLHTISPGHIWTTLYIRHRRGTTIFQSVLWLRYRLHNRRIAFWVHRGGTFFSLFQTPRPILGSTHSSTKNKLRSLSREIKRPRRETNCSHSSGVEFRNDWRYTSSPSLCFRSVHRGNFNLNKLFFLQCRNGPTWTRAASFLKFLNGT